MPIKLYIQIPRGHLFHFYDKPTRHLVKSDDTHFIGPVGAPQKIHPHVLVVHEMKKDPEIKTIKKGK